LNGKVSAINSAIGHGMHATHATQVNLITSRFHPKDTNHLRIPVIVIKDFGGS
jgi:hypothetical protein